MPKVIDEEKRRERIAEAVWNIAAEQGLDHATIRAVAAECDLSVGSIQHSFRTQEELKCFAMELVVQRVITRLNAPRELPNHESDKTIASAELLMETLPLDAEREKEARIWASFSTAALTDEKLGAYSRQMNDALERFCLECMRELNAPKASEEDSDIRLEATHLHCLLDGLTLALLIDPSTKRRQEVERIVRDFIEQCARGV